MPQIDKMALNQVWGVVGRNLIFINIRFISINIRPKEGTSLTYIVQLLEIQYVG